MPGSNFVAFASPIPIPIPIAVCAAGDGSCFVEIRLKEERPKGTINRVWRWARSATFTPEVQASPLARTPYDLRHAAVSTWLNGGVPPTQVAEWAGQSVEVPLRIYAKCLDGGDAAIRQRIERALGHDPDARPNFGTHLAQTSATGR
ncbi:hypothetical protein [Micromonospora sp. CA-111912]|uniref:hypothetical protein n=1 Tax=Micromonospora sp. CA-111912 TaxID=3239955 RepID=UPI003D9429F2